MKATLIIAAMLLYVAAYSQIVPCPSSQIKEFPKKDADFVNEQWYRFYNTDHPEMTITVIYFDRTTVGAYKIIDKATEVLKDNSLDFDAPNIDKTYLASYVKDIHDYENLSTSCRVAGSIVTKTWYKGNGALMLSMDDKHFMIECLGNLTKK